MDYDRLMNEVLRLLCQQKNLQLTGQLIARLEGQEKRPNNCGPALPLKRCKSSGTTVTLLHSGKLEVNKAPADNTEVLPTVSTETLSPNQTAPAIHETLPSVNIKQITTIISAVVDSKMARLQPPPTPTNTSPTNIDLGNENTVQQLIHASPSTSNSSDIVAHVDDKTRKAIINGEFVDFVLLLPEKSTVNSNSTN